MYKKAFSFGNIVTQVQLKKIKFNDDMVSSFKMEK